MSVKRNVSAVPEPREHPVEAPPPVLARRRRLWWLVGIGVFVAVGWWVGARWRQPAETASGGRGAVPAVPVRVAEARVGDMPRYLTGLGNVTAFNTVTVRTRVDGQIVDVAFREGQTVHQGDVLVQIDPRPFEVQLAQAEGALARDQAQLRDAQLTLARYKDLLKQAVISKQEYDDQAAKVGQFEGAVHADQGQIDAARLQLTYSRVTAPITGRVGLRLIDIGNIVHATDQNGLVVITQLQPIAVVFTIPEDQLPPVMRKLAAGETLTAEAWDRANRNRIATGTLLTADNQIDPSTGMTRLKALFQNDDGSLFPNQFVNVHLELDVQHGAVIVPGAAIQRGPQGTFVYVVGADRAVQVRPVTVGITSDTDVSVDSGLAGGDTVVTDGVDKLRAGTSVQVRGPEQAAPPRPGA